MQIGSPMDVYLHPSTPFVANFLGETNLLPCVVCGSDRGYTRVRFANGNIGSSREPRQGRVDAAQSKILVSVRPECIRFLDPSERGENVVEGVIADCTFLGKQVRFAIRALGMQIIASTTRYGLTQELTIGRNVRIGWAPDDAQVLVVEEGE
jgi:putative spermidine/putrescine transport system ATP-binding protein